jgi:hypothetical protein
MSTTILTEQEAILDDFRAAELRRVEERVDWAEEMMERIVKAGWTPPATNQQTTTKETE